MRAEDPPGRGGRERGQTTLDFAIGMGIFFLVLGFTIMFIPGLFDPFVGSTSEETVAANRVADSIANGMLADPGDPRVLDEACTTTFFLPENNDDDGNGFTAAPTDCEFEEVDDLPVRVGLQGRPAGTGLDVRVTVVREDGDGDNRADPMCKDVAPSPAVFVPEPNADCGDDAGDTVYDVQTAEPPDESGSVVVAQRGIHIDYGTGLDATLRVEVWS
jgi:hypothetical protein